MVKNFLQSSGIKAPSVKPNVASGVPGDSSRARLNEAQGQKVADAPGSVFAAPKTQAAAPVAVASGDNIVMPSDHPSAKTTRTISKGGAL